MSDMIALSSVSDNEREPLTHVDDTHENKDNNVQTALSIATTSIDPPQTRHTKAAASSSLQLPKHCQDESFDIDMVLGPLDEEETKEIVNIETVTASSLYPDSSNLTVDGAITQHPTIINPDVELDVIAQVLKKNELYIDAEVLKKLFKGGEKRKAQLIDDLCEAYINVKDDNVSLYKILSENRFSYTQRQRFYDIILKGYIKKNELNQQNFIKILKKTIKNMKIDIDWIKYEKVANIAKLKGKTLAKTINDQPNSEYKSPQQFEKVFGSIKTVKPYIWSKIYKELSAWTPHNYQKLDYDEIKQILKMNRFMNEKEIVNLESQLKAFQELVAPNELRADLSQMNEEENDPKEKRLKGYEKERFLNELCDVFGNRKDQETQCVFTNILIQRLGFNNWNKRQRVYDMLLHHYFKNYQLNNQNFIKILRVAMRQQTVNNKEQKEEEKCWSDDEIENVLSIVEKANINGWMFMKGEKEFKSSVNFAKLFTKWNGYKTKMRKIFAKLYATIKKWETKEYKTEEVIDDEIFDKEVINLIRSKEEDVHDIPKYIHKPIWHQSWDERMESLIDTAVLEVCNLPKIWDDKEFVNQIYNDFEFYFAVQKVFEETGKHVFFEEFVKKNYGREIQLWKIKMEHTNKTLMDMDTARKAIKRIDLKEFDFYNEGKINKKQFKECLLANDIRLGPNQADEIFAEIDKNNNGYIEIKEFHDHRKHSADKNALHSVSEHQHHDYWCRWNQGKCEILSQKTEDADIKIDCIDNDDRFKWYCYAEISKRVRKTFNSCHPREVINGYWKSVTDERPKNEQLSEAHLNKIAAVLNHYYKKSMQENIISLNQREENHGLIGFKIMKVRFKIIDDVIENEYELTWWNQKGRYETIAIAVKNVTDEEEQKYSDANREMCYLRFNATRNTLQWKWYDNDSSQYRRMGVYGDKEEPEVYHSLIEQLEASYLGNVRDNFDPQQWEEQFNSCCLPKLSSFLREKVFKKAKSGADVYVFCVTFRDKKEGIIENIEQIGYTHNERSAFPRNIARFINGRNSLFDFAVTSNSFVQPWMALYRLYTPQQQQYFWCFILTIVAQIKYIEIEFKNQMILLPLTDGTNTIQHQSIISELIDYQDIQREYNNSMHFDGSLIPPLEEWQVVSQLNKKENEVSKTGILRRAKPENVANPSEKDYRWLLDGESYARFQFDADHTVILRMVDVIRKFILEFEFGEVSALWPWHQNSKFCNDGTKEAVYNELMKKHNLIHEFNFEEILEKYHPENENDAEKRKNEEILEKYPKNDDETLKSEDDESEGTNDNTEAKTKHTPSIRHKRKWAAIKLLQIEMERNLNYLRHFLSVSLDTLIETASDHDDGTQNELDFSGKIDPLKLYKIISGDKATAAIHIQQLEEAKLKNIRQYISVEIENNKEYKSAHYKLWQQHKPKRRDKPNLDQLKHLHIDTFKLPFFERFMNDCFIEKDKKMYERNAHLKQNGRGYFYRVFMDSWRTVPNFWLYEHDILLLELVLRNGIDCKAIIDDIDKSSRAYKQRLYVSEGVISGIKVIKAQEHRLYAFKTWCKSNINILHRLKYVTKTIINSLNLNEETNNNTIFSLYQQETHLEFIERTDWTFANDDLTEDGNEPKGTEHRESVHSVPSFKIERTKTRVRRYTLDGDELSPKDSIKTSKMKFNKQTVNKAAVVPDRYISRDIETELFESFQAFDLMRYGRIITKFMIDKLKREAKDSHYFVLGQLFYSLPDPIGIEILWESKDVLQRGRPEKLEELCLRLKDGSVFQPSTCLSIAEFFNGLAKTDLVQAKIWKSFSKEFEEMAFDDIAQIESDHMMFVVLNTPLPNHEGRCLIQLAQEGYRVSFLNSERVSDIINHMYRNGYLRLDEPLQPKPLEYTDMLYRLFFYPFRFYLSPQGYHWVGAILYVEYLLFLFVYAYHWPSLKVLDVLFWCSNLGYILFEAHELYEKGPAQYFNLAVMGDANVMDAAVSLIWFGLFILRAVLGISQTSNYALWEQLYGFFFGIELLLITMRSFKIVNNSQYFGTLILIIKSMLKEMMKFVFIFLLMMIAVVFGLWFIGGDNMDEDHELYFWDDGMWSGLLYIFELFISARDISGFELDAYATIYLVIASFLGTLLLLNLLIALMTNKYEDAKEQAEADVMLNQTELSFDLLRRSRHMPPPLNIVMYILFIVVLLINCIGSCILIRLDRHIPSFNIFRHIHYDVFEDMKTRNIWKCKNDYVHDYDRNNPTNNTKSVQDTANSKTTDSLENRNSNRLEFFDSMGGYELLKWYCCRKKSSRMLHKVCYGRLKRSSKKHNSFPVDGITMSAYFDKYEEKMKRSIIRSDRIILNKLTAQTLFCPHCYGPFLNTEDMMDKQLVPSFIALFDTFSAIVFVAVPIAWIPLMLIMFIGAARDWLLKCFDTSDRIHEKYSNQDYDRNYFPQFVTHKIH